MINSHNSLAIVLRGRLYGESDKIVTFLTQDFGKLTGIAKGAKNSRRRFSNSLEPLARVRVYFRQRPQATLAFLESCELLDPPTALVEPGRFAYGSYFVELTDQLTMEDHPVAELYALLEEALAELGRGPATNGFLRGFELQLLTRAGYEPQLDRCMRCRCLLASTQPVFLGVAHGTFWCNGCRDPEEPLVQITASLLPQLSALKRLPLAQCRQRSLGDTATDAAQLTGRLLALHLRRPLRSMKLVAQLAAGPA